MKTLIECKDEVAVKYSYTCWSMKIHENGDHFTEKMWTEAAELYASQFKSDTHYVTDEGVSIARGKYYRKEGETEIKTGNKKP